MKCILIFPEICAKTLCPFSSSTLNMAFGKVSLTFPSTWIASSFGINKSCSPLNPAFCQGDERFAQKFEPVHPPPGWDVEYFEVGNIG